MSLLVTHLFLESMCLCLSFSTIDKVNTLFLVLLAIDMCGGFPLSDIFFLSGSLNIMSNIGMGYICIDIFFVKYLYLTNSFGYMDWNVLNGKLNGLAYMPTYMPAYILAKLIEAQHTRCFTLEGTLVSCEHSHFVRALNILCCNCKHHLKGR